MKMDDAFLDSIERDQENSKQLWEAVDAREPHEKENEGKWMTDFSNKVQQRLIDFGSMAYDRYDAFKDLPGYPEFAKVEWELFQAGVQSTLEELEKKRTVHKAFVDQLCEDIETGFKKTPDILQREKEMYYKIAQQNPASIFGYYAGFFEEKPYAVDLMAFAMTEAIARHELKGLGKSDVFQEDFPNAQNFLRAALKAAKEMKNKEAFEFILDCLFTTVPTFRGKLKNGKPIQWAAESRRHAVLGSKPHFSAPIIGSPDLSAHDFLLIGIAAANEDPRSILRDSLRILHLPEHTGEAIFNLAWENINLNYRLRLLNELDPTHMPEDFLSSFKRRIDEDVQELLALKSENVFEDFSTYSQWIDNAGYYLEEAAKTNPAEALYAYGFYDDHYYGAKDLARSAAEKLLEENPIEALGVYSRYLLPYFIPKPPFPPNYESLLLSKLAKYHPDLFHGSHDVDRILNQNLQAAQWREYTASLEKHYAEKKAFIIAHALGNIPEKDEKGEPLRQEENFWEDPALQELLLIDLDWIPEADPSARVNLMIMVARNLYWKKIEVHEDSVKDELLKIRDMREKWKDAALFTGRNVILASHLENYDPKEFYYVKNKNRFGRKGLVDSIRKDQGPGLRFDHFEAEDNFESLKDKKEKILSSIETYPEPMTFFFDGHGGPDALYLSDGEIKGTTREGKDLPNETETTIKITFVELGNALKKRWENTPHKYADILILHACYAHDFFRNLYEYLAKSNTPAPIGVCASEYGQYSFDNATSYRGADFYDALFKHTPSSNVRLKDLWNMSVPTYSNVTVYFPTEIGPQQIAKI